MNRIAFGLAVATLCITAYAQDKKGPPPAPLMMNIPALKDGAELPVEYSCSNAPAGVSPAIEWKNAPAATQSFALLLHDPEPHPQKIGRAHV